MLNLNGGPSWRVVNQVGVFPLVDDRDEAESMDLIDILETVDDELDKQDILMVKLSDHREAEEWGIDDTPAIVYFENGIPFLFEGNHKKSTYDRTFAM